MYIDSIGRSVSANGLYVLGIGSYFPTSEQPFKLDIDLVDIVSGGSPVLLRKPLITDCTHTRAKCQVHLHNPDSEAKCWFRCSDCGKEFPQGAFGCLRKIVLNLQARYPVTASGGETQTQIPQAVVQAIGEILVEYALAENTLRYLLQKLPQHDEGSTITQDLKRLKQWLPIILEQTPDEELREAFAECVRDLGTAFRDVRRKRNILSHGQLTGVSSEPIIVTSSSERAPREPGEHWLELDHPKYGALRLDEQEISKVLEAAIGFRRQVGHLSNLVDWRKSLNDPGS